MSSFKEIVINESARRYPVLERTEVSVDVLRRIAHELLHDGAPYAEHATTNEVESDYDTAETSQT